LRSKLLVLRTLLVLRSDEDTTITLNHSSLFYSFRLPLACSSRRLLARASVSVCFELQTGCANINLSIHFDCEDVPYKTRSANRRQMLFRLSFVPTLCFVLRGDVLY